MDFTQNKYRELLLALQQNDYQFFTMEQYVSMDSESRSNTRFVVLRHDIDLRAENALQVAQIEHSLGIAASYYFRVVPESNQPDIIRRIAAMGHEIGYHYEDMAIAGGDVDKAYAHFNEWLAYFRQYYPVRTICMHGAPTSRYDGRDLWKKYNYRDLDIIGEPYFDVDFDQLFYLTDTGRCFDGFRVSVRDKVPQQERWCSEGRQYHSTDDVIRAIGRDEIGAFMLTTHPQRWTNNLNQWCMELVSQSIKNIIKRLLIYVKAN